jgi:lysozyme family protein
MCHDDEYLRQLIAHHMVQFNRRHKRWILTQHSTGLSVMKVDTSTTQKTQEAKQTGEALTREDAKAIYLRDFWLRGQMDKLPPSVAFQAFDFAVNSGIETALRKLQSAVGVADDGHIGPITLAALQAMHPAKIIMLYVAERIDFWRKLKNWPRAGNGWAGRAATDLRYGARDFQ